MKLVLSILATAFLATACSDGCRNVEAARNGSPTARHDVVLFQRDCGATTGFSTHISILGVGDKPMGGGNVFVADGSPTTPGAGDPLAEAVWQADDQLLVRYNARTRVFTRKDEVEGVRISYQPVDR